MIQASFASLIAICSMQLVLVNAAGNSGIQARQLLAHPVSTLKYLYNTKVLSTHVREGSSNQKALQLNAERHLSTMQKENFITRGLDRMKNAKERNLYKDIIDKQTQLGRKVAEGRPLTESEARLYSRLSGNPYEGTTSGKGIDYSKYEAFLDRHKSLNDFDSSRKFALYKREHSELLKKHESGKLSPLEFDYFKSLNGLISKEKILSEPEFKSADTNLFKQLKYNRKTTKLESFKEKAPVDVLALKEDSGKPLPPVPQSNTQSAGSPLSRSPSLVSVNAQPNGANTEAVPLASKRSRSPSVGTANEQPNGAITEALSPRSPVKVNLQANEGNTEALLQPLI